MSRSTNSIALRIALILAENTEKEIGAAVRILRENGYGSELLKFLNDGGRRKIAPKQGAHAPVSGKALDGVTSRAVLRLRETSPEKFQVLSEFDLLVRRRQLLASNESLRRFGERLSKDFKPRKSRKDTIGALMSVIADRPLLEIEKLVQYAASLGISGSTDEYQRLAQFLIEGKPD